MQRRKFVQSTALASALPLTFAAASQLNPTAPERELYEIRTYEMRFGGNAELLLDYLKNALRPALERKGCQLQIFKEYGDAMPTNIWAIITYPDATTYLQAQDLSMDLDYVEATKTYDAVPAEALIYNRFTSSLLLAFTGMPQMVVPPADAGLIELRTYEGYSEDAVRRKIGMFNKEEFPLFDKTGLHRVLFGEVLAGPHRPALTYFLHFKNMEEREANWKTFLDHPEWKTMVVKPEYADSVSNIRRVFLTPIR